MSRRQPLLGMHAVDPRARAHALAAFFGAGAALTSAIVLLPGWDGADRAGLAVTVVLAAAGALLLRLLGERAGAGSVHLLTAAGTALIAACQVLAGGGPATATYAMLYVWVILHAALFSPPSAVAAHLAGTALAQTGALLWLGETAALPPQLAVTVGTQLAAALVVGPLARQQRRLADTDPLTGLGNRRVVDRSLRWALHHSRRHPELPTCVAAFDLDGFKAYNDAEGHAAGDRALVELAARWSSRMRTTDTLARVGGDEFVAVLHGCELDDARRAAARMAADVPAGLGCSVGVVCFDGLEAPDELLGRADQALYRVKAGRGGERSATGRR